MNPQGERVAPGTSDLRPDDTTAATAVLREATAAYEVATSNYWQQRELGGIVPVLAAVDNADGVRYRAATYAGGVALMKWQRARAEVLHAMAVRRRELERWAGRR